MPLLSIIVPVYNTEPYLPKCIDSILAQTFTDFECILIDDGSTDNSGKICDDYAARDDRIIVIHQPNAGVSSARNKGLEIMRGKYVGFVDSDDWIDPEMYKAMFAANLDDKFDIVICGIRYYYTSKPGVEDSLLTSGEYNREQLLEEIFGTPNRIGGGCCNKIFKTSKISDVRYDINLTMAEDWFFLFEALRGCDLGIKVSQPYYCVYERSGSATRGCNEFYSSNRLFTSLLLLLSLCRDQEPWLEGKATNKYFDDCVRYMPLIRKNGKDYHQHYHLCIVKIKWKMIKTIARAWWKKLLPGSVLIRFLYLCLKV